MPHNRMLHTRMSRTRRSEMQAYFSGLSFRISNTMVFCAILALTGLTACKRDQDAEQPQPAAATRTAPRIESHLSLVNNNGSLRYDGSIDSEAHQKQVADALIRANGAERVSGNLTVKPNATPPDWIANFGAFAEAFSAPGAAISFEGNQIILSGQVSMTERKRLLERTRALYPDHELGGLLRGVDGAAGAADNTPDIAAQSLSALPSSPTPEQLDGALKQVTVRFDPGSARIQPDSLDILSRAAQAIARSPDATKVKILARASAAGLARQRAEATKAQLILNGAGPGKLETNGQVSPDGNDELSFSVSR